jgi:steroid 5-alpha reductase family enzyme
MVAVMMGLRCQGSEHAWMALSLDWRGWALLKVTGIPWTERQALASWGEDYREYQRTTNAFFPWFPRGSQ